MREIKFRGKTTANNVWVYGYYVHDDEKDKHYIYKLFKNVSHSGSIIAIEVIPETVGQFTGEKDNDGDELYEDDVVLGGDLALKVKFQNGGFGFFTKRGDLVSNIETSAHKKIGNIHDNPELM